MDTEPRTSRARTPGPAVVLAVVCALAVLGGAVRRAPAPPPPSPSATPAPAPGMVRAFSVTPAEDRVQVDVTHTFAEPLVLELAEDNGPWRMAGTLAAAKTGAGRALAGLKPDTGYAIRARAGERDVISRCTFRTEHASFRRTVDAAAATVRLPLADRGVGIAALVSSYPNDPRIAAALLEALEKNAHPDLTGVHALGHWNRRTRHPGLALKLVQHLDALHDPIHRIEVLASAAHSHLAQAPTLVARELASIDNPNAASRLLIAAFDAGLTVPFETIVALVESRPVDPPRAAARLLAWSDPVRAKTQALAWLRERGGPPTKSTVAAFVLVALDDASTVLALLREPAIAAQPRDLLRALALLAPAEACASLTDLARTAPEEAFAALALLGCPDAGDTIEAAARHAPDQLVRLLGVSALARAGRVEALRAQLQSDQIAADLAAWTAGLTGEHRVQAEIASRVRQGLDPNGVALWAYARLAGAEAAPLVLEALAKPATSVSEQARLGLAAWAAGELELAAAAPRLRALAADRGLPLFTRNCARDALLESRPLQYFLPPFAIMAPSGLRLPAGASYVVHANVLPTGDVAATDSLPLEMFRAGERVERSSPDRSFLGLAAGCEHWPVEGKPQRRFFGGGGPLVFFARPEEVGKNTLRGAFVRITLTP